MTPTLVLVDALDRVLRLRVDRDRNGEIVGAHLTIFGGSGYIEVSLGPADVTKVTAALCPPEPGNA